MNIHLIKNKTRNRDNRYPQQYVIVCKEMATRGLVLSKLVSRNSWLEGGCGLATRWKWSIPISRFPAVWSEIATVGASSYCIRTLIHRPFYRWNCHSLPLAAFPSAAGLSPAGHLRANLFCFDNRFPGAQSLLLLHLIRVIFAWVQIRFFYRYNAWELLTFPCFSPLSFLQSL